jgi:hypothetical protein
MQSQLSNGVLPPGIQAAVDQATQGALAHTRQQYQQMGLGGSTMEAQAIQATYQQAAAQSAGIAQQMLASGASQAQVSQGLLAAMMESYRQQDNGLNNALGGFLGALGKVTG